MNLLISSDSQQILFHLKLFFARSRQAKYLNCISVRYLPSALKYILLLRLKNRLKNAMKQTLYVLLHTLL